MIRLAPLPRLAAPNTTSPRFTLPSLSKQCRIRPRRNHKLHPALNRIHHKGVARFVARYTQRFEIRRVVRTALAQLQYMMNMATKQFNRAAAVAAAPAITLIDVLTKRTPQLNGHPRVPGKVQPWQFVKRECFVALNIPCHAIPPPTMPYPATDGLASPHQTATTKVKPCHAMPVLAAPMLTLPKQSTPPPTTPQPQRLNLTLPCPALPCLAVPCRALPRRAIP